jgi:hypothetical protein
VLEPGGTFLFNVWDVLESSDLASAVAAGLESAFPGNSPTFLTSFPHSYANTDVIAADLHAAGFEHVDAQTVVLEGRSPSVADLVDGFCRGTPMFGEIQSRGDLDMAVSVIAKGTAEHLGIDVLDEVVGKMSALVIQAQ